MIMFDGKYAFCKVFIDYIDEATQTQIYSFLNHPSFKGSKIRIMSDCHAGAGAVVGTTATMTNSVIPNVVGVDIGCGVLICNIGKIGCIDFQKLDDHIRKVIPIGFNHHQRSSILHKRLPHKLAQRYDVFKKLEKRKSTFTKADLNEKKPHLMSIGSLGGGNHFIELGKDDEENIWITIHSGSRGFGLDIAKWHQRRAKALMKEMFIGAAHRQLEFLTKATGMEDYLHDMKVAQEYAQLNREIMMFRLLEFFGKNFKPLETIESVHNYISFTDNVIRKGAISAHKDEKVVIPFNMEDGLIIGVGLGNNDWNNSAPHGAGRVASRTWAKANLSLEKAKKNMKDKGIWTSSLSEDTLDEVKEAYKDKDTIIEAIGETVKILKWVKPIYSLKAGKKVDAL